jgi:hypothetical protein
LRGLEAFQRDEFGSRDPERDRGIRELLGDCSRGRNRFFADANVRAAAGQLQHAGAAAAIAVARLDVAELLCLFGLPRP